MIFCTQAPAICPGRIGATSCARIENHTVSGPVVFPESGQSLDLMWVSVEASRAVIPAP